MKKILICILGCVILSTLFTSADYDRYVIMDKIFKDIYYKDGIFMIDSFGNPLYAYNYKDNLYVPLRSFSEMLFYNFKTNEDYSSSDIFSPVGVEPFIYGEKKDFTKCTMEELLINPEKYDGKEIQITAPFKCEFECEAFFLTKEDMELLNLSNCVWLELYNEKLVDIIFNLRKYNGGTALIEGVYSAESNYIENISYMEVI